MTTQPLPLTAVTLRARLVSPETPTSIPLVPGHLHVALTAYDGIETRDVGEADLAAWDTTLQALLPQARARLVRESALVEWIPVRTVPGMSLYQATDGQSSSRMLAMNDLIEDFPVSGVLVAVPSEDQMMAIALHELDDLDALDVMVTATRFAWQDAARKLSDQVFWFDGAHWYHVDVVHHGEDATVTLPLPARLAVERLAAMGFVALAAEA